MDVSGGEEVCRVIRRDGDETWRTVWNGGIFMLHGAEETGPPRRRETDVAAMGQRLDDAVHAELEAGATDVRRAALERALAILASPGDGEEISDVAWPYFVLPDGSPAAAQAADRGRVGGVAGDPRGRGSRRETGSRRGLRRCRSRRDRGCRQLGSDGRAGRVARQRWQFPSSSARRSGPETGRHVHAVRRRGQVPAVLYGHNVEPQALSIDARSLQRVWHHAGHSHLVDLALDGGRARKVLIRELQVNPRTTALMHVDLFAVNLREKLTVEIPLIPIGESPAVSELKLGVLQQIITAVKVECMPGDIPAQLNVDISGLVEIDQGIRLGEVPLPERVTLATGVDPDELVLKVAQVRVAAEAEEAEAAPVEGEGEAAETGDDDSESS